MAPVAGTGAQGFPRVPQQKDVRTRRALRRFAGTNATGGTSPGFTTHTTFATKPAPGNVGNLAFFTDSNIFARDNGTSWEYFGPSLSGITLASNQNFFWLNQGSTSVDFTTGIMVMAVFANGGSNVIGAQLATAPTPPYGLFIQLSSNIPPSTAAGGNNPEVGIFAWDHVVGKGLLWGPSWRPASGMSMEYQLFTAVNSATDGPYANTPVTHVGGFPWIGYIDDAVNRKLLIGNPDGNRFGVIYSEARNANGGVGAAFTPDQIGVGINPCSPATSFQLSLTVYSFAFDLTVPHG